MSSFSSQALAAVPTLVGLAAHLAAGFAVGVVYFLAIWRSARLFGEGGRAITVLSLTIARVALLVGSLTLASLEGAPRLLAMAFGALIARAVVVHKIGGLAS
ncbi:MAG: ATP synthase subunit I [Roseiarcus sp.]